MKSKGVLDRILTSARKENNDDVKSILFKFSLHKEIDNLWTILETLVQALLSPLQTGELSGLSTDSLGEPPKFRYVVGEIKFPAKLPLSRRALTNTSGPLTISLFFLMLLATSACIREIVQLIRLSWRRELVRVVRKVCGGTEKATRCVPLCDAELELAPPD
jgi:hypothetical protein